MDLTISAPSQTPEGQLALDAEFTVAYVNVHPRALAHAERFLPGDEAREVVDEAMAQVWFRWAELTPAQRTDGYFLRAVHNGVVDASNAAGKRVPLEKAEEELEHWQARQFDAPTARDTALDVLDLAIAAMPRKRRRVLLLIHAQSCGYEEAATALGLSLGTIKTHIRLAHDDLRHAFRRAGFRVAEGKGRNAHLLPFPEGALHPRGRHRGEAQTAAAPKAA